MIFILRTLVRSRRLIILAGLGTAIVMAGIGFVLPKWYTAVSTVFPPDTRSATPTYADIVQSLQLPLLGPTASGARPNTIYIDILLSRTVGQQILEDFDLMKVYGAGLISDGIDKLHKHTTFDLLENGLLKIAFEDEDPERAAAVTNRFVELLDEFNRDLNVARASKTKEFIAGQMEIHASDLVGAEETLKTFREQNQALELNEQVRSAIDVVSNLMAKAITIEMDLKILNQYTSRTSQEYLRKKREYDEVKNQLRKFKVVESRAENDDMRSFFPSFDEVPKVSLELARLTRAVTIEETVYEMLIKEYEMARIEEARDTPTVQVLDAAAVPETRSRPRRKMLVIIGAVIGVGWSSLLAIFLAFWRRENETNGMIRDLIAPIRSDVRKLLRKE